MPQGQSYGFASFATLEEAQAVLDMAAQTPLVTPEGVPLRLNWARGSLPEWKRGEARSGGCAPEGAPVLHPRVRCEAGLEREYCHEMYPRSNTDQRPFIPTAPGRPRSGRPPWFPPSTRARSQR